MPTHTPLNQETVLRYLRLQRGRGPIDIIFLRFGIDGQGGEVFAESRVLRILRALESKGLVREMDGEWEATDKA